MSDPGRAVGERLVFLVGARRSGTNWLHSLMSLHPQLVKVPSETHLFFTLAELQERFQHGVIGSPNTGATYLPRADLVAGFRQLCDRAFEIQLQAAGAGPEDLLVERTPLHAQHLDLIAEIYPQAPVVHLIRDGRDVARSLVRQPWGPDRLADAAREWVDTVSKARADQPPRYLEVRHEDLVADPVTTMSTVWEFLGLATPPAMSEQVVAAASRPINRTPDADRSPADSADLREIEAVAGDLLQELGYPAATTEPTRKPVAKPSGGRWSRTKSPDRSARGAGDIPWDQLQRTVDQAMGAIATRDVAALAALFSPSVEVRIRNTGESRSGDDGIEAAAALLIDAASPTGTQIRGDSFSGRPSFTVVWSHDDGGDVAHRVFVVSVSQMLRITAIDYYRLV